MTNWHPPQNELDTFYSYWHSNECFILGGAKCNVLQSIFLKESTSLIHIQKEL